MKSKPKVYIKKLGEILIEIQKEKPNEERSIILKRKIAKYKKFLS